MKIHRVVLLIVDSDDIGAESVADVIENARYPNHCIGPSVMRIDTREVEWSDEHPLNQSDTSQKAFEELFKEVKP